MRSLFRELSPASCLIAFFSAAFQAFGMYNIHALAGVTEGGIFGLILLLDHHFHISPSISSIVLNGICYFLGWRTLGKTFIAYSVIATAGYSACYAICECFPPLFPAIAELPLLAAILGALFIGIGAGLCVRIGGATSGDDALSMSLSAILKQPIERIYLVSDLSVLALSLTYIPLRRIGYSLLTVLISGQIIGLIQKCKRPKI